jgi:hypothetical protein
MTHTEVYRGRTISCSLSQRVHEHVWRVEIEGLPGLGAITIAAPDASSALDDALRSARQVVDIAECFGERRGHGPAAPGLRHS